MRPRARAAKERPVDRTRLARRLALAVVAATLAACSAASTRAWLDRDVEATFADGVATTGRLPAEFREERQLFLAVTVNGVATTALLDSGASVTALDRAFAARIGVTPDRQISVRGFGGKAAAGLARGVAIGIGSLRLEGLSVAILDISDAAKRTGREIAVILGAEVFERVVVEADAGGRAIAFHDPAGFRPPPDATLVPLARDGLGRAVRISIEGREDVDATFDLGCAFPLVLRHAYWSREGLLEHRRSSTGLALGVGGRFEQSVARIASLRFGGVEFPGVPAAFLPADEGSTGTGATAAVLGLPVLARFHLWIDYPHDALYVVPDVARRRATFDGDRLGLTFEAEAGTLRVIHVAASSPAAGAGFRVGDRIAAIDGRAASEWTPLDQRALGTRPAGTTATFRLVDGTSRRVTLDDYY